MTELTARPASPVHAPAPLPTQRRRLARFALLGAGCLLGAAAIAGCSSSSSGTGGSGNGIVPTDAAIVATVDLRRGATDPIGRIHTLAKRIPAEALVDSKVTAEGIVASIASSSKTKVTYAKDLKPWVGKEAGVAAWLQHGTWGKGDMPLEAIAWIDSTDDAKAEKAALKVGGKGTVSKVDGVSVHHVTKDKSWWAVLDRHVVVGSSKSAISRAISASKGDALEGSDEWKALGTFHAKGDPALTVRFTKAFRDQLDRAGKHYAGSKDASQKTAGKELGTVADALKDLHGVGVGIGANNDALWLDVRVRSTHGSAANPSGGSATDRLGKLPASTLLGAAGAIDTQGMVKQVQDADYGKRLDDALGAMDSGSLTPQQQAMMADVKSLVHGLLAKDQLQAIADSYGDGISAAVLAKDGKLALTFQQDIKDAKGARAYESGVVQQLDPLVAKYLKGVHLTVEPGAGTNDAVNYVLGGLPVAAMLKDVPKARFVLAAKFVGPDTVADFQKGRVVVATDITGDTERISLPRWGLTELDSPDHLSSVPRFTKDLKTTGVPSDADYVSWVDIQGIVQYALAFVPKSQATAAGLVTAQTRGLGGIVAYAVSGKDGDLHTRDDVVQLPIYEG